MIIDELISLIGFKIDEGGASKAKSALSGVEAAANKLVGVLGAAGLAAGFMKLVEHGHAASETMERLDTLFGPAGAGVKAWSDAFGKEVGRSRADLQQMTASVGAMVTPMGVTGDKAAEMGERLAELAVNLAELNNAEDPQTLDALRMALTGNTRALRQYGLVIDEAEMKEAARELGIHKGIKSLNDAEKAQVSYQAILKKGATIAQAGLDPTEAWNARIQNLRDTIGLKLLPIAERMAEVAIRVIDFFEQLAQNTNLVESAFIALVPVALSLAASFVGPMLPAVALFAGLFLLVDELITLFEGGDTVIGRFIDSLGGVGTSKKLVDELKQAFQDLSKTIEENKETISKVFDFLVFQARLLLGTVKLIGTSLGSIGFAVMNAVNSAGAQIEALKRGDVSGAVEHMKIGLHGFSAPIEDVGRVIREDFIGREPRLPPPLPVVPTVNVTNNFNGVKPGEVDQRVKDAAGNSGKHMARQLRDVAAAVPR